MATQEIFIDAPQRNGLTARSQGFGRSLLLLYFVHIYYLFCHRTALDADYWTICTLIIAISTSCWEKSAPALEFPVIQCIVNFFEFLSTEFAAFSKPPSRYNHRKVSHPYSTGGNNNTKVRVEPRSCNQGRPRNDALILSAKLQTYVSAVATVNFGSIPGLVKSKTGEIGFHSFPA